MKIQLLRHATCLICFHGKKILLDPLLSPAGTMAAIPNVPNEQNNPVVNLPDNVKMPELMAQLDAVMITHTHRDHFDNAAMELLSKDLPVFCQPQDAGKISVAGFLKVNPVVDNLIWNDIAIYRTSGQHGTGITGHKMGPVSGFVLKTAAEPSLYIAGDSIWCLKIKKTLKKYQPEIIICFAGGAQFQIGGPITMAKPDIYNLAGNAQQAKIVAVHMEAWNHCRLSREELKTFLKEKSIADRVYVPDNGEELNFYSAANPGASA